MSKPKRIRVSVGFSKTSDVNLVVRGAAVHTGMTGNPAYPHPPVELEIFKTTLDTYSAAIADALDGGRKARTERQRLREAVIKMLRQLGSYVEANCNDDMATFTTSGFEAAFTTRIPVQALSQPRVRKIDQGTSGQLLITITAPSRARLYELRYAALVGGTPGSWKMEQLISARVIPPINNLSPGTTYAFQVRAMNKLGYTDWSDSITRMCI